jgi:hypothetical protein
MLGFAASQKPGPDIFFQVLIGFKLHLPFAAKTKILRADASTEPLGGACSYRFLPIQRMIGQRQKTTVGNVYANQKPTYWEILVKFRKAERRSDGQHTFSA